MSNPDSEIVSECKMATGCSAVRMILTPKVKDLGGFSVRRALPVIACRSVGPWVFFDHMGPAEFDAGQGIDVRPHPHIGLATVTYLFEGEMLHRDSLGNTQVIRPGEINLMVAGRGIVHSERQRPEVKAAPQKIHGLQLWLALPTEQEQTEPAFYHYEHTDIPESKQNNVLTRVMMGSAYGVTSPVKTHSKTLYVEARLQKGQSLRLPDAEERAIYVVQGAITLNKTLITTDSMVILENLPDLAITASSDTVIAIIGGSPLGNRHLEWNFVASNQALIEQAKLDWSAGRFDKVPGDDKEFIPLPG